MKTITCLVLMLAVALVVGCGPDVRTETHERTVYRSNVQPVDSPTTTPSTVTHTTSSSNGNSSSTAPDWVNNTIQVTGNSAIDTNRYPNPGQAVLMAKRGAKLDALRSMVEQVLGLRIDSQTTVKDMVTESDHIASESNGLIRGFRVIGENPDHASGIYTVTMELKLYDVWEYSKRQHQTIR
jgi:hypothetical protein